MTQQVQASKATWWAAAKAVAWSFLGIRRGKDFQQDISQLKPYHLIAGGVVGVLLLIVCLIVVVNWIVPHGPT
jgi:uncharacterized membrane protein AbrB (regulator of aidB expression)